MKYPFGLGKPRLKPGRIGVALAPDHITVARADASGAIVACERLAADDNAAALKSLVAERGWSNTPASLVLHYNDYQLLLAEQPPVQGEELSQAMRWKVRELLDFPLEEAALEAFSLPDDAYRGRQKMAYVAALRKVELEASARLVEASGLALDCIEISELALHNLVSRTELSGGTAVLHLDERGGFINLVEQGAMYLTRALEVGMETLLQGGRTEPDRSWETLLLEVQRSRDYYESQMGKGIVTGLLYSPDQVELVPLAEYLANQLGLEVQPLELARSASVADDIGLAQRAAGTLAIGAALGPVRETEVKRAAR